MTTTGNSPWATGGASGDGTPSAARFNSLSIIGTVSSGISAQPMKAIISCTSSAEGGGGSSPPESRKARMWGRARALASVWASGDMKPS